ncbi:Uncharacterised protein [Vibrio cholerae]|uniref:Uncharacterized protein n=1 Tax=Vibrio cholerae TaxID=666 RepID=A0A655P3B7_VIBCL|nr:Uncharacterised protein [Vibrio cholerae]CSI90157.1 Uncharacterised protein [Vibrio cholerae]
MHQLAFNHRTIQLTRFALHIMRNVKLKLAKFRTCGKVASK